MARPPDDISKAPKPGNMPDTTFAENLVGYNLRRAYAAHMQRFAAIFGDENIRPVQFTLLGHLYHNPGLNQSELGNALDIQRANLVTLLDELESRQLLRRETAEYDRRSRVLRLTDEGLALARRLLELHERMEAELDAHLGKDNRMQLVSLLKTIRNLDPNR